MKIYSDTLRTGDLYNAADEARVILWVCEKMPRTRIREHGWIVSLSGSSPYRSQVEGHHQAATWDEHGVWMDLLFKIDPEARIAGYDGREDFLAQTREHRDSMQRYMREVGIQRRGFDGPWLAEEVAADAA